MDTLFEERVEIKRKIDEQEKKLENVPNKVSIYLHRALVTATIWLQGIVVYQALIIILFYNNAGSTPA